jgi:A/G-specific adenine glycosylase
LLPQGKAGEFNQAMMELGEVICNPRRPKCIICPLTSHCYAFKTGTQDQLPQRIKKVEVPHYNVVAAVIQKQRQVLIGKRPSKGLLGGLWEFPGGKCQAEESMEQALKREIQEELALNISIQRYIGLYQHAYTHFKVSLQAYHCRAEGECEPQCKVHDALKWVSIDELKHFPMSRLDRRIALDVERTINEQPSTI